MLEARFNTQLGSFSLDVELHAESGTTTVLLGGSGSGKSTVLRLLAGLLKPDDGYFALDGALYVDTTTKVNAPTQARPIGYCFQEYVLFPHMSVFDNVGFGLKMQGADEDTIRERVATALENARLVGYDDRRPSQLSGGQQQRVAIARALALQPRPLLLDESLSALDIQTRQEVRQELRTILAELDVTTVMVSHQYGDALVFGDQILVLEGGKVLQQGQHIDLLSQPRSRYVAEMVGVNFFEGRVVEATADGVFRVSLARDRSVGSLVSATLDRNEDARPGPSEDVSVVVDPRNVALHAAAPDGDGTNVLRGEVVQALPVSTTYSETSGVMEGLMRVAVEIDHEIPPLRADVTVGDGDALPFELGTEVFASFEAAQTRIFR